MNSFLNKHKLNPYYLLKAEHTFAALLNQINTMANKTTETVFIGINGCQGSGKTTLADYLVMQLKEKWQINAISCSLDDFYLSKNKRKQLAQSIHPLFKTRGVPGTHNIELLEQTLANFAKQKVNWRLAKFDKSTDNPQPKSRWPMITQKMNVVIIEGWCWGVLPQSPEALITPVNNLEKQQDPTRQWRNYVNQQLQDNYQPLFKQMNLTVMLKAPSFDCVYQWRLEQEQKLAKTASSSMMNEQDIAQFIQYFQRLTEHALKVLPEQVDFLFELDKNRQIT